MSEEETKIVEGFQPKPIPTAEKCPIPPTPVVISQMKKHLKLYLPPDLFEKVEDHLKPWPMFRLDCSFRPFGELEMSLEDKAITEVTEMKENLYDDIDLCLGHHTRLKNYLKHRFFKDGVLRVRVDYKCKVESDWSNFYVDEILITKPTEEKENLQL